MFVSADGATVSIQDGNVPKHLHPDANEIQYILEGTGTIWLGDKEVQVKPGDLVIIPHGTPHGGTKPDGRPFKAIAIKTPPQTPDDVKLLNGLRRLSTVIARSDSDEAIQSSHRRAMDCFAYARNDGKSLPPPIGRVRPPHQQPPLDQRHRR